MITLTRLSGSVFALNSDLIERVDATPDTVITLVDGTKYVVLETLQQVVAAIRAYRGAIIAESARLAGEPEYAEPRPADPGGPATPGGPSPVGSSSEERRRRLMAVPGTGDARAEEGR